MNWKVLLLAPLVSEIVYVKLIIFLKCLIEFISKALWVFGFLVGRKFNYAISLKDKTLFNFLFIPILVMIHFLKSNHFI